MNDSPAPATDPAAPPQAAPVRTARDPVPILYVAGFAVLAAGLLYLLFSPPQPGGPAPATADQVAALEARLAAAETRANAVPALVERAGRAEQRLAALDGVAALTERVAAAEQALAALPPVPPLAERLAAAEAALATLTPVAQLPGRVQEAERRLAALAEGGNGVERRVAQAEERLRGAEDRLDQAAQRVRLLDGLATLESRLAAVEGRPAPDLTPLERAAAALGERLAAVEARPLPPQGDFAPRTDVASLSARQDAVAARQDQLAARQQATEGDLNNRIAATEQALAGRLAALQRALEERLAGTERGQGDRLAALDRALAERTGALERALAERTQAVSQTAEQRVAALEGRVASVERAAGQVPALAERAARLARAAAARAALEAGQPLGAIAAAPEALARFAEQAPPTEAALRLAFPEVARMVREAAAPAPGGTGVLDQALARAQGLVTVRRGEEVVVGDASAGILATAERALAAGDLPGAVAALRRLQGNPAAAAAEWLGRAQALLDARAALASLSG